MKKMLVGARPSPALIVACVALFVALGGTSIALPGANTVDKNDLKARVVGARNIKNAAVTRRTIKEFAVGVRQLANAAVVTRKIRDRSVTNSKLAANAVGTGKIANGAVNGAKIANGSVGAAKLGATTVHTSDSPPTADADGNSNGGAVGVATATANCGTGEKLLSGGAQWTTNQTPATTKQLFLRESHPAGNGWTAVGNVDFGAQGQAVLRAFAVCIK